MIKWSHNTTYDWPFSNPEGDVPKMRPYDRDGWYIWCAFFGLSYRDHLPPPENTITSIRRDRKAHQLYSIPDFPISCQDACGVNREEESELAWGRIFSQSRRSICPRNHLSFVTLPQRLISFYAYAPYCFILSGDFDYTCTMRTSSSSCDSRRLSLRKKKMVSLSCYFFARTFGCSIYSFTQSINGFYRYPSKFLEVPLMKYSPCTWIHLYISSCMDMASREALILSIEWVARSSTRYRKSCTPCHSNWCGTWSSIFDLLTDIHPPSCNCFSCISECRNHLYSRLCSLTLIRTGDNSNFRPFYYRKTSHYSRWTLYVQENYWMYFYTDRTHDHNMIR